MIVIDASVVVELLTTVGTTTRLHERLQNETLIAPEHLPVEVASALRGLNRGGLISDDRLQTAASDLGRLRVDLIATVPLVHRILALRHNFSAYDAAYVVLADVSAGTLMTLDRRMARSAAQHCAVDVVAR